MGARSVIKKENAPLSIEECRARKALITRFLEEKGEYVQEVDGYYVKEREPTVMHGLGLDEKCLQKIYAENFLDFALE